MLKLYRELWTRCELSSCTKCSKIGLRQVEKFFLFLYTTQISAPIKFWFYQPKIHSLRLSYWKKHWMPIKGLSEHSGICADTSSLVLYFRWFTWCPVNNYELTQNAVAIINKKSKRSISYCSDFRGNWENKCAWGPISNF